MQNFFSNLAPSGGGDAGAAGPNSDVPWWMKYAAKGAGIGGGVVAIFFGVWCCVSLSPICIVAGIWQICAGFLVITLEAPFCCMFLDFVQQFAGMVEGRPVWQKALLYLILSLPSMFLCASLSTIVGSGLIFMTSVLYGLQILGKKASREEMAAVAGTGPRHSESQQSGLVGNIHGQDIEAAKAAT